MKLDELRNKIDSIDEKILTHLAQRMCLVAKVKKIKMHQKLPIEDKSREIAVAQKVETKGKQLGLSAAFVNKIFNLILKESKRMQKNL